MQHQIRNAGTHLEVELSGVPTVGEMEAMLQQLLGQSGGLKRALIQVRVARGIDFVGTKSLVEGLPRLGFPPDFRFAVWLLDEQARRSAEFAQDVAENRGIRVQVFSERAAALTWLLA